MLSRPDVLVLGGGGVLGEAWMMGVLAGLEDATGFDLRECEVFVGTSAGAIVSAHLASGRAPRRPSDVRGAPDTLRLDGRLPVLARAALAAGRRTGEAALAAGGAIAPLALGAAEPGGALLRAAMLARLRRPSRGLGPLTDQVERLGARFDGRLRVVAVARRTGRRVVFGTPRAPTASVGEAVAASCSVPWMFAPVSIAGRDYVDGGVWSPTNLDVAPASRDTHVLCLNPLAGGLGSGGLGTLWRGAARSVLSVEALALRRRGAIVRMVTPDLASRGELGLDFMLAEPRHRVAATGYHQGLTLGAG